MIADKASITVPAEYSDFKNVFTKESAAILPKHTKINIHAIDLKEGKQPFHETIYNLRPMELEILKTQIKINLANKFICLSKSPIDAPILFDKKPNESFQFCVNY